MMQHKCTNCGKLYAKDSDEILTGCSCGHTLFYFVKAKTATKSEIIESVEYFTEAEDDPAITLDLENINILCDGKYELDLAALMATPGVVYRYGDGKYSIDLNQLKKKDL